VAPIDCSRYHPVAHRIVKLLQAADCWYETFEHAPVRTSEEAARTRPGYTLHQGVKAIICSTKGKSGNRFLILVFPGDRKFDSKRVRTALGASGVRFATEEEVASLTDGVVPGAVPPFGNLFGLEVLADASLFENERIVFNAGDQRFSVAMRSADFRALEQPGVGDIVQHDS
jgi:prolyl-tRNA editing enzyme YbaK/EbsC (Cys-tRNA(Pro) deacylase)